MDLKISSSKYINELLEPVRKHFEENQNAKEIQCIVEGYAIKK